MRATQLVTGIVLIGLMATPAFAQDGRRQRDADQRGQQRQGQGDRRGGQRTGERAVPRESVRPVQPQAQRQPEARQQDQNDVRLNDQVRSGNQNRSGGYRADQVRRYDDRGVQSRRYDNRSQAVGRAYYPYYSNRGYGSRTFIVPRIVRPTIVTVVPYRPYYYRPSIGIGVYYGSGGAYPYGYTPRGYYDPMPGRPYGGLRITGAPRYAQVFADGYYVGIVNDFDGIFQHVNLEAGPHRIEIVMPGYEDQAIQFDVMVQPGRTTTFRADRYGY